ncbi:hypothetical protein SLEP1_g44712 [Rubroshorea leprosula]|uniref:Peptidase M16 C-terminal domain-containing protein n=1 Tax=Rubroshorea leprosula TaxID=152421 RepID=A0AAV5LHI9_9ROSI|nr:hypothetical protein SLEP1_g44712 [Rubroshorea leprosula]
MVLAASGVVHEQLLQIAEPLLSDVPSGTYMEEPKSYYVGGDYRQQADSPSTHFALAFEVPGGWKNEKVAITITMTILQRYSWQKVAHFQAVIQGNGCTHGCSPDFASKAVDVAVEELTLVAKHGAVPQLQLQHAKEALQF